MTSIQLIACIGMVTGFFILLRLSPMEFTDGVFRRLTSRPKSLKDEINELTHRKKKSFLRREIADTQNILKMTGREAKFPAICAMSLLLFVVGASAAIMLGNFFLVPVLAVGMMFVPFWFIKLTASYWCDHGWWEFDLDRYSASLSATMRITPDNKNPTAGSRSMKSGYGVNQLVTTDVSSTQSSATTPAQNAVSYGYDVIGGGVSLYIYPDNLKSKATLWLWELRDIGIVGIGCLISVFALAQLGFILPIVFTAAYAFLSIRIEDTSILDFIRYALQFFVLRQQT